MKYFILAAVMALSACTTGSITSDNSTVKVAGTAETAFQAFLLAEETLLSTGKIDENTYHTQIDTGHTYLLDARTGKITYDALKSELNTLVPGAVK